MNYKLTDAVSFFVHLNERWLLQNITDTWRLAGFKMDKTFTLVRRISELW